MVSYCDLLKKRSLTPDRPFQRDIAIFGGAGGYTFRCSGEHRIWATFHISKTKVLQSNEVIVAIRSLSYNPKRQTRDREFLNVLRRAGKPLFYKHSRASRLEREAVRFIGTHFKRESASASALFAEARIEHARFRNPLVGRGNSQRIKDLYQKAAGHPLQPSYRRKKAEEYAKDLDFTH